jgi:large conductance mechanosensitive channel
MKIIKEFKEFALKGNLIEIAVAFVMGAAFGKVVSGFIDGIVMPIVGKITAGVDFKSLKYVLSEAQYDVSGKLLTPEASIKYGEFVTVLIDFTLVAFFMFIVVKAMNKAKNKKETTPEKAPAPTVEQTLLTEIRDLLKSK